MEKRRERKGQCWTSNHHVEDHEECKIEVKTGDKRGNEKNCCTILDQSLVSHHVRYFNRKDEAEGYRDDHDDHHKRIRACFDLYGSSMEVIIREKIYGDDTPVINESSAKTDEHYS